MDLKYCSRCNSNKPPSDFWKGAGWCKACMKEYRQQPDRKARANEDTKRYRRNNPEKTRLWNQRYRDMHRVSVRENARRYYQQKREWFKSYRLLYRTKNHARVRTWERRYDKKRHPRVRRIEK